MGGRLLLLAVLVVAVTACSGGGGGPLASRATYEGSGFTLEYPQGWEVVEGGRIDTSSQVELISQDSQGPLPPLIRVTRQPAAGLKDVNALAASVVASVREKTEELTIAEQAEASVEGAKSAVSLQLSYTDEVDGASVDVRELVLVAQPASDDGGSRGVTVVHFVAPADRFEELQGSFEELLTSVELN